MSSIVQVNRCAITALMLLGSLTLAGCHALIAQPLRAAMQGDETARHAERIRGKSCEVLASDIDSLQKAIAGGAAQIVIDTWRESISELEQARAAKSCSASSQVVASQRAPIKVEPNLAVAGAAGRTGHLGVSIGNVDAAMAKALGLKTQRGAMVVELDSPAPSGGNTLKPLDVVLEITGKAVNNSADLQNAVQGMRPGDRALLRIWRDRAEKKLVVAIGAAPVVRQATSPATTVAVAVPDRPLPVGEGPAGPPRFCYAFLVQVGKPVGVQSSLWEERGPDFGHPALLRSMGGFLSHMRHVQAGIWHDDISPGKCVVNPRDTQCMANSTRTFGTPQLLQQFCHETREQAEAGRKPRGAGLPVIEWAPPVAR